MSQEPQALTVSQFCAVVGCSRASAYRWIGNGTLKAVRLGARYLIPLSELERLELNR
jgi:excisionase family DNA binding protein